MKKNKCNNIILRGELHGGILKGSGNSKNPANSIKIPQIKFFGVDKINVYGVAEKMTYEEECKFCDENKIHQVTKVFHKQFNSKEELIDCCDNYFKNNFIEGIVVKTEDCKLSAKIMNLEYDSKK